MEKRHFEDESSSDSDDELVNNYEIDDFRLNVSKMLQPSLKQIDNIISSSVVSKKGMNVDNSQSKTIKDKSDRATTEQVLDPKTRMVLFKLLNKGVINTLHG